MGNTKLNTQIINSQLFYSNMLRYIRNILINPKKVQPVLDNNTDNQKICLCSHYYFYGKCSHILSVC